MKVLVLGAAVSGAAAARLLRAGGEEVLVYDRSSEAAAGLAAEGCRVAEGEWRADLLKGVELVVASPGFPERSAPLEDARRAGLPVWSEVELAFRHLEAPVVGVTGTNGKTTVTRLAAEMLSASGLKTVAAGNIGTPLSDVVGESWDVVVVELSSFQLRFVERFHAPVAVLLNVAPDHLDWHGDEESYRRAKAGIFRNHTSDDLLVFDADDPGAARLVEEAPSRLTPVSGRRRPAGGWGPVDDVLRLPDAEIPLERLPRRDPVHLVNLAAAGAAARAAGAQPEAVLEAALAFRVSPHRRQTVGEWGGVEWVDDSKATNPHAALAAITSYPSVVLIAGGRNKGLDLAPLVEAPEVRHVLALGEAAAELEAAGGPERVTRVASMDEAVRAADGWAVAGDTVLLAPGCASFDMYGSYAERGEDFARAVRELKAEAGGAP